MGRGAGTLSGEAEAVEMMNEMVQVSRHQTPQTLRGHAKDFRLCQSMRASKGLNRMVLWQDSISIFKRTLCLLCEECMGMGKGEPGKEEAGVKENDTVINLYYEQ